MILKAPFPWFGGKSKAAATIWDALGDVPNYVEPFAGSLAVLLGRPHSPRIETVNDKDAYICNAWRAIQSSPEDTARWADWPVNESDLHARHVWLRSRRDELSRRLEADPEYYDAKIAGWWLWGMSCWIGGGFCGPSGAGPWQVRDGQLVHLGDAGVGVTRKRVHLNAGQGVTRRRVHLGNTGQGVARKRVHLSGAGMGVKRQLGNAGLGIIDWFRALQFRLTRVRVCCGDWTRILGPTPTTKLGMTGVLLDPPYSLSERNIDCYNEDSEGLSHDVAAWAREHGDNPLLRIVLCGYAGKHQMPPSWNTMIWSTSGGYGQQGNGRGQENRHRECLWFSPYCLPVVHHPNRRQPTFDFASILPVD